MTDILFETLCKELDDRFVVTSFGVDQGSDLDLLMVGSAQSMGEADSQSRRVCQALKAAQEQSPFVAIARNEHKYLIKADVPLLHVLYYPSNEHLKVREPFSLISCCYEVGTFLLGDRDSFLESHLIYRARSAMPAQDVRFIQMALYADLIVLNLLYLYLDSPVFSLQTHYELLRYALRFTTCELLLDQNALNNDVWRLQPLIRLLEKRYPKQETLIRLLSSPDHSPQAGHLRNLFHGALRLTYSHGDLLAGEDVFEVSVQ